MRFAGRKDDRLDMLQLAAKINLPQCCGGLCESRKCRRMALGIRRFIALLMWFIRCAFPFLYQFHNAANVAEPAYADLGSFRHPESAIYIAARQ